MQLLVVLLSIILVLNAAFLALLILIQLPKKEAGAGLAFGAGATDALFGAGSGNALTKMTKYAATAFLALVLTLSILSQRMADAGSSTIESLLEKQAATPAPLNVPGATNPVVGAPAANAPAPAVTPAPVTTTPAPETAPAGNATEPAANPAPEAK